MTTSAIDSVTPQQAKEMLATEEAAVIDVRMPYDWAGERIPGSINLPLQAIKFRKGEVPEDKKLLFVSADDKRSREAAEAARDLGFADVFVIEGGFDAWASSGFDVDTIG